MITFAVREDDEPLATVGEGIKLGVINHSYMLLRMGLKKSLS